MVQSGEGNFSRFGAAKLDECLGLGDVSGAVVRLQCGEAISSTTRSRTKEALSNQIIVGP